MSISSLPPVSDYLQTQQLDGSGDALADDLGFPDTPTGAVPSTSCSSPSNTTIVLQCPYTATNCPILAPYAYNMSSTSMPALQIGTPDTYNPLASLAMPIPFCVTAHSGVAPPSASPSAAARSAPSAPSAPSGSTVSPVSRVAELPSISLQDTSVIDYHSEHNHANSTNYTSQLTRPISPDVQEGQSHKLRSVTPELEDMADYDADIAEGGCTPFISKLYHLCNHDDYSKYIRWNEGGDAFVLAHANTKFASSVLPRFFRHNSMASFMRQLNLYSFERIPTIQLLNSIDTDHSTFPTFPISAFSGFSHPYFRRGNTTSLRMIRPKPNKARQARKAAAAAAEAAAVLSGGGKAKSWKAR